MAFEPERWTHVVAAVLVVLGWFAYIAAIPAWHDVAYFGSVLPTLLIYLTLDVMLASVYVFVARRCRVRRWRMIYLSIGAALFAVAGTDTLDTLVEAGVLAWAPGQATDLIWIGPIGLLVLAARLPHAPRWSDAAPRTDRLELYPAHHARSGAMVLLGAFSFLLVHTWLQSTLPSTTPDVARAQGILVLVMLGLLGTLSVSMYRLLGGSHRRLAESQHLVLDRLRDAQRMEAFGQLAGGVAHDFNNVLTSIVGYNDVALERLPADDPARPALEHIAVSARRASDLTRQLLALSRRQLLKPEPTDLAAVVAPLVPMLARTLGERVRLEADLAGPLPLVMVDPSQVRSVVLTLAANARDAMPDGGTITIAARANASVSGPRVRHTATGRYVELTVHDTGPHIPLTNQIRLFEPFYAAGGSGRGAGLSLAAVQGAVAQSGGTIDIRSEPGCGATFAVRLPVVGAHGKHGEESP